MKPVRIAIALVLPESVAISLTKIQKEHSLPPWSPKIDLHITLVSPFTTHHTVDMIVGRMALIAKNRKSFHVILDGLGRFDNEESFIFAQVTPNEHLKRLADDAMAPLLDVRQHRSRPFVPHVTLAAAASRQTVDGYFKRLVGTAIHEEFTCDRFALLQLDETAKSWKVANEFIFN